MEVDPLSAAAQLFLQLAVVFCCEEAESQFKSSLKLADNVVTVMELCKVYLRMDQPNTALPPQLLLSCFYTLLLS